MIKLAVFLLCLFGIPYSTTIKLLIDTTESGYDDLDYRLLDINTHQEVRWKSSSSFTYAIIKDVAPGQYFLDMRSRNSNTQKACNQVYNKKSDVSLADTIHVVEQDTMFLPIKLLKGGTVSGTIKDLDGAPPSKPVNVYAWPVSDPEMPYRIYKSYNETHIQELDMFSSSTTDSLGNFTIKSLFPTHHFIFAHNGYSRSMLANGYFKPTTGTKDSVNINKNETTVLAPWLLPPSSCIRGSITWHTKILLTIITAQSVDDTSIISEYLSFVKDDSIANYEITGLPNGRYIVWIRGLFYEQSDSTVEANDIYYPFTTSKSSATIIQVDSQNCTENINFVYNSTFAEKHLSLPHNHILTFPNPSSKSIQLTFERIPQEKQAKVFDISGKLIKTINISSNCINWDGKNDKGLQITPGTYFISIDRKVVTIKLIP
jgi:hypothetical protein